MRRASNVASLAATLAAMLWSLGLAGCSSKSTDSNTPATGAQTSAEHHDMDHMDGDHMPDDGDAATDMDKMMAEVAKLSPEDAASVMAQHYCPVSGDMLGADGPPIKLDIQGQTVWICCEDCRDAIVNHPDEYLAKLKLPAAQ